MYKLHLFKNYVTDGLYCTWNRLKPYNWLFSSVVTSWRLRKWYFNLFFQFQKLAPLNLQHINVRAIFRQYNSAKNNFGALMFRSGKGVDVNYSILKSWFHQAENYLCLCLRFNTSSSKNQSFLEEEVHFRFPKITYLSLITIHMIQKSLICEWFLEIHKWTSSSRKEWLLEE